MVVQVADHEVGSPWRRDRRIEPEPLGVAPIEVGKVRVRGALDDVEAGLRRGRENR